MKVQTIGVGKLERKGGTKMRLVRGMLGVLCLVALLLVSAPVAMAQEPGAGTLEVSNLRVDPAESSVGRTVMIKADVTNKGDAEGTYTVTLKIDGKDEGSQNMPLKAGETKGVEFKYTPVEAGTYTVAIGDKTTTLKVVLPGEAKFREGPVVKLRPVTDEIDSSKDGLVELFFSNPSLNDVTLQGDIYVSVPSGIHVYGEGFGLAAAAGTVYGQFNSPPGTARTIYLNIKADETAAGKTHFIHFSGQYWPDGNKDAYNPISLTHPFKVLEASPNPYDPSPTNPKQIAESEVGGIWIGWWIIIGAVGFLGIVAVVAVWARRTEVTIEK